MEKISDFQIVRELGRGAMGVVYEAIEEPLNRKVALKVMHPEVAVQQNFSVRFQTEAHNMAGLSHPSIIKVFRFGFVDNTYFLALEYIDGLPLDKILTKERLPINRIIDVLIAVADALTHAHLLNIIHRDIKPGNILMHNTGKTFLGDFGLAKDIKIESHNLTLPGTIVGTPVYISPEQAQSQPISAMSDIYSLGVMAFEMVTGRVPFTADTPVAVMIKHIIEAPPSILNLEPNVPKALVSLIEQMLEKSPERRPQNCKEVVRSLEAIKKQLNIEPAYKFSPIEIIVKDDVSILQEMDVTVVAFELAGFSKDITQQFLPMKIAFLLESWYRLVRKVVKDNSGIVDRCVGDRVNAVFGYPEQFKDHAYRAFRAAKTLGQLLTGFNAAHDLNLNMRSGIACGKAMVGHIVGDRISTSIQGSLLAEMKLLSKTKVVNRPIRLNQSAYEWVQEAGNFIAFDDPVVGKAWATTLDEK